MTDATFVDGRSAAGSSSAVGEVVNPADGTVIDNVTRNADGIQRLLS